MLQSPVRTLALAAGTTLLALAVACTSPTAPPAATSHSTIHASTWGGPPWGGPPWGAQPVKN